MITSLHMTEHLLSGCPALGYAIEFLESTADVKLDPLRRLLDALVSVGRVPMLAPRNTGGRPPERPSRERMKGRLAGVAEIRFRCGSPLDEACEWVAKNIPKELAQKMSPKRPIGSSTIKDWRKLYSGAGGEPGMARNAYRNAIELSDALAMTSPQLRDQVLKTIISWPQGRLAS
jgi:hypothetical protein